MTAGDEHVEMSFGDHLEELRSRLLKAVFATFLAFIIVFNWHEPVLRLVVEPFTAIAKDLHLNALLNVRSPTDSFFAYMKVSLIVALLVSAPIWMWQFWAFVGVGLYDHERKSVYRFVPPMVLLFAGGVAFGYFVLIPVGLRYLLSFADPGVLQNWIGLSEYLSLFTTLTLVLGLVFELPIVMALLAKIGLVKSTTFREKRRFFILGAFVFGALLTPPDAVTQVLMAAPLCVLFEIGVLCAWFAEPERQSIAWSRWRKRGLILAGIAALIFYFQSEILTSYRERLVAQRIVRAEDPPSEGLPYFQLLRESGLGFSATQLFQVRRTDDEELVIVGDGKQSRLIELKFRDQRVNMTSDDGQVARFTVSAGTHAVVLDRVAEMPGHEFMGLVVEALAHASDDEFPELEALAAGLLKTRPEGTRELGTDEDESSLAEVRSAWADWWDRARDSWTYRLQDLQ